MWLLGASFDGEHEPPSERTLCLGRAYVLGRKAGAVDVVVPVDRVSRVAGTLTLAAASADGTVPRATWTMHAGSKSGGMLESMRGRNRVEQRVRADSAVDVGDRTRIWLTRGVCAELRWVPVCPACTRMPAWDTHTRARAQRAGVRPVHARPLPPCTHLCVPHARPDKTQLLALVRGVPVVSEAFLGALLDAADRGGAFPDVAAFPPPADPHLPADARIPAAQLLPDARRASLFSGATLLVLVPSRARCYMDPVEIAQAAGAHVQVHDLSAGAADARAAHALVHALHDAAERHWAAVASPPVRTGTFLLGGGEAATHGDAPAHGDPALHDDAAMFAAADADATMDLTDPPPRGDATMDVTDPSPRGGPAHVAAPDDGGVQDLHDDLSSSQADISLRICRTRSCTVFSAALSAAASDSVPPGVSARWPTFAAAPGSARAVPGGHPATPGSHLAPARGHTDRTALLPRGYAFRRPARARSPGGHGSCTYR
ncbi:hypothetical protein MSPP1_000973 [Malassezia sp. CBS 17886]|nr:hypothetical protein MSPP1_000973 [Malassezia sp. CBS 17886]